MGLQAEFPVSASRADTHHPGVGNGVPAGRAYQRDLHDRLFTCPALLGLTCPALLGRKYSVIGRKQPPLSRHAL